MMLLVRMGERSRPVQLRMEDGAIQAPSRIIRLQERRTPTSERTAMIGGERTSERANERTSVTTGRFLRAVVLIPSIRQHP